MALVNSSGTVLERYNYTPYGEVTFLNSSFATISSSTIDNTHLYTGRERDPETGLQLNRHRYYASHLGRWLTWDPIGYLSSANLYEYVGTRPIDLLDPFGLIQITCRCWSANWGSWNVHDIATDCMGRAENCCKDACSGAGLGDPTGYWHVGPPRIDYIEIPPEPPSDQLMIDGGLMMFGGCIWKGGEFVLSKGCRICPTGHIGGPFGKGGGPWYRSLPHYHRRPGIGKHRPWERGF